MNVNFLVAIIPIVVINFVVLGAGGCSFNDVYNVLYNDVTGPVTLACTGRALSNSAPDVDCTAICPLNVFVQIVVTRIVVVFFI